MKLSYKILAVLLSVIIGLLIGEVIVRIQGHYYVWSELNGYGWVWSGSDKNPYYWVHHPGDHHYDTPDFNYAVHINSLGVRDTMHSIQNPDSSIRIVGLGDSFTEGSGAPFDSTWLNQLVALLQPECSRRIEPIVGGVASSDFFYAYVLLRDKLLQYKPDYVVLALNQTDYGDFLERGGFDRFERDSLTTKKAPALEPFFAHSHLVRMVFIDLLGYSWNLHSPKQQKIDWDNYVAQYELALDKYQALADSAGFKFAIIFHPVYWEGESGKYLLDMQTLMDQAAKRHIPTVDALPLVYGYTDSGKNINEIFWPTDQHFNGIGYSLMARTLQPLMTEELRQECGAR